MSLGRMLDSVTVQKGLLELCPDLAFDLPNKLSEWQYILQTTPENRFDPTRMGVYYRERFLCAMDRGPMPEIKQWELVDRWVECPLTEGMADDVLVSHETVAPTDRRYREFLSRAAAGDPSYEVSDGRATRYWCMRKKKVKGRVVQLGWRHTFMHLCMEKIPGLTQQSIGEKFGVDMFARVSGTPDEVRDVFFAE